MSEVKKDFEDISAGIGQFIKKYIYKNCLEFDVKVG
jgi:hypothetical protein